MVGRSRVKSYTPIFIDYRDSKNELRKVKCWPIGELAMRCDDRRPPAMRRWERVGYLPRPIFSSAREPLHRYYSEEECQAVVRVMREEGIRSGSSFEKTAFRQKLAAEWYRIKKEFMGETD